ncbi:hypothetical protein EPUS_06683 [Endocarpon pusillum Z07020]|uniref:Uncharacterized protein n=1 Tax=Endocarpon pusillum (strain Z07020 / HMAS-L-300199) TaxID=1263415 RepID=U1GBD0_ENDPU|nr:uncharacterized protein EPUS_06683 [Endocarpon pusillum Z07020]ERF68996.1 hypothetical protein EPUS_06683 [Endocarpon pusillum Z07020]
MGRQAYITRLALGRSPYEAPVLSESGEYILGPYAHEFENTDNYTQQYDERGHPENRESRVAARDLRRAKNDVLSTVGVVYKKAEPRNPKNDGELLRTVQSENEAGFLLSSMDNLFMFCALWWLFSLRMRVEAFKSYSIPLLQIAKAELRVSGMKRFLFAGLPACLVSAMLSSWRRYWMSERLSRWLAESRTSQIFNFAYFLLFSSFEILGTLQCLHLTPTGQSMSITSLLPSSRQSPIQLPTSVFGALTSPILLLWAYTSVNQHLQSMLWYIIRSVTVKPDKADTISYLALEGIEDAEVKVPGLRERPWTLRDEVRLLSSKLRRWFDDIVRPFSEQRRTSEDEPLHLHTESGNARSPGPGEGDSERASTATPDPADLFNPNDFNEQLIPQSPSAESQPHPLSRANTLFTPLNQSPATTPPVSPRVRASLIHRDSQTVTMQLELLESQHEAFEDFHNEATAALQQIDNHNNNNTHEIAEQHTSTEGEVAGAAAAASPHISPTALQPARAINSQDQSSPQQGHQTPAPRHRVTALSNFPSDAFASHAACLLATAALIPLESLFVRSLASTFLRSCSSPLARDMRPLFEWRWRGWRYHGTLLALVGLQALVSSAVWGVGTAVAVGLGRGRYRWVAAGGGPVM